MADWDYSSKYCDGCAELGLTTCSCEPDGFEDDVICDNCGQPLPYDTGLCDECQDEEDNLFGNPDE